MGADYAVVQGVGRVISRAVYQSDGVTPSAAYQPTDTLQARVWTGDAEAPLFAPAAAWDATNGPPYYDVTIVPSQTAAVSAGLYGLQVIATRPSTGMTDTLFDGQLEVLQAPGSASAPAVYIGLQHLRGVVPDIDSYQQKYRDSTGFAAQRADARLWVEEAVHRHFDGTGNIQSDIFPQAFPYRWAGKSPIVVTWLANNYLVMSQPLVKAQVYYTLSQIFSGLVLSNPRLYQEQARQYQIKAENALRGCTAEIRSGGSLQWYPGYGGCYDGTLLALVDFSQVVVLRG